MAVQSEKAHARSVPAGDVSRGAAGDVLSLALSGLHHLHGEAAHVLRLRRHPATQRPQA